MDPSRAPYDIVTSGEYKDEPVDAVVRDIAGVIKAMVLFTTVDIGVIACPSTPITLSIEDRTIGDVLDEIAYIFDLEWTIERGVFHMTPASPETRQRRTASSMLAG